MPSISHATPCDRALETDSQPQSCPIPDELFDRLRYSWQTAFRTRSSEDYNALNIVLGEAKALLGIRYWNQFIDALDTIKPDWRGICLEVNTEAAIDGE